jgi:hypothetical protein
LQQARLGSLLSRVGATPHQPRTKIRAKTIGPSALS